MEHPRRRREGALTLAIALLALLGVIVVVSSWGEIYKVLAQADWRLLPVVLLLTAVSYACLSISFAISSGVFGVQMSPKDLFYVGFVSYALDYLMASAGTAGFSIRMLFFKRRGLPVRDILAASLFHSALNNLILLVLIPVGFVYLILNHPLPRSVFVGLGLTTGVLFILVVFAALVIFIGGVRNLTLRLVGRAWRLVARRDATPQLKDLESALAYGVTGIRNRPEVLALLLALVAADWAFSVGTLGFCFGALGTPVGVGVLLTGFTIGVVAGLLSMVPGGLGVQEGSMAAVFALLGVSFGHAVLAAILFRIVYYFVPFLFSLGFYRRLLRRRTGDEVIR